MTCIFDACPTQIAFAQRIFHAICSLKCTSVKYVPKGDTSKMYRIAHRIREANFSCDVLLTVQNGCAVNEKDLKC